MSRWALYAIMMADNVSTCTILLTVCTSLITVILTVAMIISITDSGDYDLVPYVKKAVFIALSLCLLACVIPDTKQLATIYVLPKVVANEQVQAIPDKMLRLMNQQLDKWLDTEEEDNADTK